MQRSCLALGDGYSPTQIHRHRTVMRERRRVSVCVCEERGELCVGVREGVRWVRESVCDFKRRRRDWGGGSERMRVCVHERDKKRLRKRQCNYIV